MANKTPDEVKEILKKLSAADQVVVQTYIAGLKQTITELRENQGIKVEHDEGHAHYHGHAKCTHDHGHSDQAHDHEETGKGESDGHAHGHSHENHEAHNHGHAHDHKEKEDDIPEWKKKAMNADPDTAPFGGSWNAESSVDATNDPDLPPLYQGTGTNDDFDKATSLKIQASDAKSSGDYKTALEKYTEAILAAAPSALLYANRADALLKLSKAKYSIRDCDEALKLNPDSAKALRIRGLAKKSLEMYEEALKDLSQAQAIDYDDSVAEHLKICTEKHMEAERVRGEQRQQETERMRKRAEEIKKAREEAAAEQSRASPPPGGMPGGMGGGMPGGMAGLMSGLMSDPELAAGMQNPKVMKAFSDLMSGPGGPMGLMSNPAKLQELMQDEDVGPFLKKLMSKMSGLGGMPGMASPAAGVNDEDMPDIPDVEDRKSVV